MRNKKGFTLIELLVVIAIIGLLSTLAVVSLNTARSKARDAKRLSDVKSISTIFEMDAANAGGTALTCAASAHHVKTTLCNQGSSDLATLSRFQDPDDSGSLAACAANPTAKCAYSLSTNAGGTAVGATTANYQICFYLENAAGNLTAGKNSIINGGVQQPGVCL